MTRAALGRIGAVMAFNGILYFSWPAHPLGIGYLLVGLSALAMAHYFKWLAEKEILSTTKETGQE